jgi:hypothetical protein
MVLAGCGSSHSYRPAEPNRSAVGDADIRQLVLDAAADGRTCDKVRDRFVGLPVEGGPTGAMAAMTPIGGRWWIRGCAVAREGTRLRLRLAGPAWYRVDHEEDGFSVHQDVYFNVDAQMTGALDIGYDPVARLASLWFTPTQDADVRIEPLARINLHAETPGAFLLKMFTFGLVPSAVARAEVVSKGEENFRRRLDSGVTITVAMDLNRNNQVDLLVGQLARGQAPLRPFTDGAPWLLNEREALFLGGAQVAGPFPPQATVLDAVVEQGAGADYALVCARDVQLAFNNVSVGASPDFPPAAVFMRGQVTRGALQSAPISVPCPWYLVSTTRDANAVVAIRIRDQGTLPVGNGSVVVRLTLLEFEIEPHKPSGSAWDALGGAPDPEISVWHRRLRYVLVPAMQDTFKSAPGVAAPEPLELTPGAPIEIRATDKDLADDDEIGTAVLRFEDVQRGSEFTLPLRLNNATTGSVRLRVEVVR